jgi:hypothetical protein
MNSIDVRSLTSIRRTMNTTVAKRSSEHQSRHDGWVRAIAKDRFAFPNAEHPTWRTAINPGSEKNRNVTVAGVEFHPDIVVWDEAKTTGNLVMIAEVETEDSVSQQEVAQWRTYAKVAPRPFFLYVPSGSGAKARQLAAGIPIAGFREYRNQNGKGVYTNV